MVLIFISLSALVNSQTVFLEAAPQNDALAAPTPYQFSYSAPAEGGGSSHEQTGDGFGRVTGSYTVADEDGRQRIVNYVADEGGFRASISTNEPGTSSQNPADVTIESSADNGDQNFAAPAPAVIPFAPAAPVAITRPSPRRPALRRQVPVRPAAFQPTLVPIQPTVIPIQPTIIPFNNQRLQNQPFIVPIEAFGGNRFIPIQSGGQIAQPTLIPISDNTFQAFNPFGNSLILSAA